MERNVCREREAKCIEEQAPACTATCPVHVDVRGMLAAVGRQDFAAGFALLARSVPFPRLISRICDHPCQQKCKRNEAGDAIEIRALEQACADYGDRPAGRVLAAPKQSRKVAVVGGGLSGLTVAFDLTQKGYSVTIYEAADRIGGRIWTFSEQQLPRQLIEADLAALSALGAEIRCNVRAGTGEEVDYDGLREKYDAIYVGTGVIDREMWQAEIDPETQATGQDKIFAGGGLTPYSPITSVLQGRIAAISIDRFLQNASLSAGRESLGSYETKLYTSLKGVAPRLAIPAASGASGYTQAEAGAEALRCLQCHCLECVKVCEYLGHFGSYPKRYVREIYNNDTIVMGIHHANKMVNSCALCGLCAKVCPNGLDMGEVCLDARQGMVAKGKMPPSAHDFALRDMEFSTGENFAMARHQPGFAASQYLFYPGCQLGASAPDQVEKAYDYLRQKLDGGVGLMLDCCGSPAEWAGRQDLFQSKLQAFESEWRRLGSPCIIAACASCCRIFGQYLPHIPVKSLWEMIDRVGLPAGASAPDNGALCIHDPCSARQASQMQDQVRTLLAKTGVTVEEPELTRELTTCCSYGGLMSFSNPEVAKKVVQSRISASTEDFVVYCAMCRDNFASGGKRALHVLDILWPDGTDAAARRAPDFSMRRENRARLKNKLLHELWGENMSESNESITMEISPELRKTMEERMILVEDVRQVILHAETSGESLMDQATGRRIAHFRPGSVTYWVEYSQLGDGFLVHNAYSHRMMVIEEAGL